MSMMSTRDMASALFRPSFVGMVEKVRSLRALVCAAAGLAVTIPAHAGYNYLVSRVNSIVLEMERAATEIVQIVTEGVKPQPQP